MGTENAQVLCVMVYLFIAAMSANGVSGSSKDRITQFAYFGAAIMWPLTLVAVVFAAVAAFIYRAPSLWRSLAIELMRDVDKESE